jgi:hypothetical protein
LRIRDVLIAVSIAFLALGSAYSSPSPAVPCDLHAASADRAGVGCARAWFDANLRINEIQMVGTAESYKLRPQDLMLSLIKMGSPEDAQEVDFSEPTIPNQLNAGARSLGFDVAYDPKGGLYANPAGALLAMEILSDKYVSAMSAPGFKVIHILDIDFNSSCMTLIICLHTVADWSHSHRDHLPIIIAIKTNDDPTPMPRATTPAKFDAAAFDALDSTIRSVFSRDELITPDMVQGGYPTLRDAVLAKNWPTIGASRGKVLFLLDDSQQKVALYRGARRSLEGRAMFVSTDSKSPVAGFVTVEDPTKASAAIAADVKTGLIVRTFADANAKEARANNMARRDGAFASGAQIVSTNFIIADNRVGKYQVRLPQNHVAQCDVQTALSRCMGVDVETGRVSLVAAR